MSKTTDNDASTCWAVIAAAGSGERMGSGVAKQYLSVAGHPVICWALRPFLAESRVSGVVVVLAPGDREWSECAPDTGDKLFLTTQGGSERAESVRNGLRALEAYAQPADWVLVHDAARPCLAAEDLTCLLGKLWDDDVGGLLALPVRDTLKQEVPGAGTVQATVARRGMWLAQTPQMFRYQVLCDALDAAIASGERVTDESAAIERAGLSPRLVEARPHNLKITYPQDLGIAEHLLPREF